MRAKTRKLLQIAAIFCIYLIVNITVVHALAITHNPSSDVTVTAGQAEVRWTTDAESDSTVEYGTSSALGSTQSDSVPATSHLITLTGLGAAQTYFYKLASSGNGEVATADNSGSLYSFTMPAASASADTAPPQFNVSLPEYYNRRQITFGGYTDPDSILKLYVNQNQADIGTDRYTQLTTSDSSGHFIFKYINLAQENSITIWARDPAGNTNTATYKVTVDAEDPVVQMKDLPSISASTSLSVNGTVNEDVTVTIAVNNATTTQEAKAGSFNLQLTLREGVKNKIDLQFSDKAGNVFEKEYVMDVDTHGPRIVWNNLGSLSPSYIQDVEVEGNVTKPGATIVVFVNNKTYSSESWSTSIKDMFVNYGSILTEGDQEYVTKADARGHFKVKVFLTQEIASSKTEFMQDPYRTSPTYTQTPPGGAPTTYGTSTTAVGQVTSGSTGRYSNAWDNTIVIVAFDELGRSDKTSPAIVTFARCGYGADWNIQVKNPTPSVITPEHLRQGIAQIAFAVNLEWQGMGKSQKILGKPVVQQYKLSEDMKKHYVFDPNELMSNRPNGVWSTDNKRGYVVIDLNKKDYQQKNLSNLKKEDLIIKLPLLIEIQYQYDDGSGALVTGVQKQCWDVSTVLDVQIPPSVIPKELLNASVQFLNSTISAINRILKPLKAITIVVFVTCLLSWVMYFIALMKKAYDCMDSKEGKESQACFESKENAKKVEKYMHYVCDRIFCPSAPTADYYFQEMSASEDCRGKPLTAAMKKDDKGCGQEYMEQWDSSCLLMNELERSKCIRYQEGDSQFQESCAESGQMLKNLWYGASDFCRKKDQQTQRMFIVGSGNTAEKYIIENGRARKVVSETTTGGIAKAEGGGYVQRGTAGPTTYNTGPFGKKHIGQEDYVLDDYDDQGRLTYKDKTGRRGYVCMNKEVPNQIDTVIVPKEGEKLSDECKPMTLPPELMDTLKLPQTRKYVVNPTDNLLTAMQCVCLPAINGFLTLWRNMLGAIMQCFQSIIVTGQGSTGLCRAVLTTYLCDVIFNAIRCFVNKYGAGMASRENPKSGISMFFKSAAAAGTDIQKSISGRYGPSTLYKTMFSERKLINAVCLWAFTGDFDFDIGSALTGPGAIPLKSQAFLYPRTRRFIASNPLTGYTTHIYHVGAGLVAGSDMGYKLQLVCTSTNSCDPTQGFPNGQCDCWNKKEDLKDITSSFGPGRLKAGEMLGPNEGDIYVKVSEAKYRYDKVRLTYWYTDNQGAQQTIVEEGDLTQIGGNPPAECSFDLAAGVFRCAYEIGDMGYALFLEVPKPEKNRYGLDDTINLNFKVDKRSPQKPQEGPATYTNYDQLPFFLVWSIISPGGKKIGKNEVRSVIADGITDYSGAIPKITVTEDLIMGRGVGKDYEPFEKPSDAGSLLKVADFDSSGMSGSERPDFALYAAQTVSEETLKKDPEKKDNIEPYRVFKVKVCGGDVKDKEVSGQIKKEFIKSGNCVEVSEESDTDVNGLKFESRPNSKILRVTYKGMWVDLTYESIPLPAKKGTIVWNGIIMRHLEEVKSTMECRTTYISSSPAKLTIKIGLYPCKAKDDKQPKSIVNCDPDTTPVDYFGTVQEHEIVVDMVCSQGDQEVQYTCPLGVKLNSPCECRQEAVGKNDCGPDMPKGDYCVYDALNWMCKRYVACPISTAAKPILINDGERATLIEAGVAGVNRYYCDCSDYPNMEDCTAKYCYPKGGQLGCYPDPPSS